MKGLKLRGSFGLATTIRLFLGLRMIILALIVGAGIMIMQLSQDNISVGPLYVLLILSYLTGGVFYASIYLGLKPAIGLWVLMIADIAVETFMLHYSGGVTSQFSLVYCLTIIAAAYLLQVPGGLAIATLASFCYTAYGILETKGLVTPAIFRGNSLGLPSLGFLEAYMHVSLFFLVGIVGGYLTEKMKLKGRQLQNAESEIEQLRVDTDNILRNMSSGVLVADSGGNILTINPMGCQILGLKREVVESGSIDANIEQFMPQFKRELDHAINSEESKHRHEFSVNTQSGRQVPLGISISLLKDGEGNKRGVIAVFQDLTEVRDMQERVRKADRLAAVGELSAGIAHEIRNPLASISGSIEMLYHDLELDGENKRLMELILNESDRLDRIISDFLEYAGLRPPSTDQVSVCRCLDDVLVLLRNSPNVNDGIKTEVTHESGDVEVLFDEEQMKQVFLNLALNGCEAMTDGGTLTIATRTVGNWVKIAFRDEGEGVGDEARTRLFEPFFTTKEGGTGLGLAIANRIVEAHGGRIEVRNVEGGGAEFAVMFPLNDNSGSQKNHKLLGSVG